MESVSREEVVDSWLRQDLEKHGESSAIDVDELGESEKAAELLKLNPDAASPFLKQSFDWYKTELSKNGFRQLQTVWPNLGVPDFTVTELGRELDRSDSEVAEAIAESSINEDKIRETAESYPRRESNDPLIVTVVTTGTACIADGNYRATGVALHMAQGGEYYQQTAYVGFAVPTTASNFIRKFRKAAMRYLGKFL